MLEKVGGLFLLSSLIEVEAFSILPDPHPLPTPANRRRGRGLIYPKEFSPSDQWGNPPILRGAADLSSPSDGPMSNPFFFSSIPEEGREEGGYLGWPEATFLAQAVTHGHTRFL